MKIQTLAGALALGAVFALGAPTDVQADYRGRSRHSQHRHNRSCAPTYDHSYRYNDHSYRRYNDHSYRYGGYGYDSYGYGGGYGHDSYRYGGYDPYYYAPAPRAYRSPRCYRPRFRIGYW